MSQNVWEVILEVGAEGGSIALYGKQTPYGWVFSREMVDQSLMLLEDGQEIRKVDEAHTWGQALKLISEYPWHRLYPKFVQPAFADRVFQAAIRRLGNFEGRDFEQKRRWAKICNIENTR